MQNFVHSTVDFKRVRSVQFGVLSPDEITRMSVVEVVRPLTFDGKRPVEGGLADPRFGPADKASPCQTCMMKETECPGKKKILREPLLCAPVTCCNR